MNIDAFVRELPDLFDDFPRSTQPRTGRRFDDIIAGMPSLAEENNLALLNLAASHLEPGECYVEVGSYLGASVIGAARGNEGHEFVAVDRFGFGPLDLSARGRGELPRSTRAGLEENLERFGAEVTVLEGDAFEVINRGELRDRRVGVYYYDADHSHEAELAGLRLIEPWLAPRAVLIADNTETESVKRAISDYLAGQPRARLLLDIPGRDSGYPHWWDGVQVIAW